MRTDPNHNFKFPPNERVQIINLQSAPVIITRMKRTYLSGRSILYIVPVRVQVSLLERYWYLVL